VRQVVDVPLRGGVAVNAQPQRSWYGFSLPACSGFIIVVGI
jgi:hypothetical protein